MKKIVSAKEALVVSLLLPLGMISDGVTAQADQTAQAIGLQNGLSFTPAVQASLQYDDNITNAPSGEEVESWVAIASPRFILESDRGTANYSLQYALSYGDYLSDSRDDFTDHELFGSGAWDINSKNRVALFASYLDIHDDFFDSFTDEVDDLLLEQDRYRNTDISAVYGYGAEEARGSLDITLGATDRNYVENVRGIDWSSEYAAVDFGLRIGSKTELLLQVAGEEFDYDDNANIIDPDNKEISYLGGFARDGEFISVRLLAGIGIKKFRDPEVEDYQRPRWELEATWEPNALGTVSLTTASRALETRGVGDYIDTRSIFGVWGYEWTGRLSTNMLLGYTNADFVGADLEEHMRRANFSIDYQLLSWLSVGLGVAAVEQNASLLGVDFARNRSFISFEASL